MTKLALLICLVMGTFALFVGNTNGIIYNMLSAIVLVLIEIRDHIVENSPS